MSVYIGNNQLLDTIPLAAGAAVRTDYAGVNNGPLHVVSSGNVPILATVRVLYGAGSYSEMMGYPGNQLAGEFWYPVYDNQAVWSQFRASNIGSQATTVSVYIGNNQLVDSIPLAAGAAVRKNYVLNDGPLHVVSSAGVPILTTVRTLYNSQGYYEMLGYPGSELTSTYWFPWYDSTSVDSQLRFAIPPPP